MESEPTTDLNRIAQQEAQLVFTKFSPDIAWELGSALRRRAILLGRGLVLDISLHDRQLFACATPGATPHLADWVRRKRNTVLRCHRSSYGVGLRAETEGHDFFQKSGVSVSEYATYGGGFPITVHGYGCLGAVTVSGLTQREDHALVVEVLAAHLGQSILELVFSSVQDQTPKDQK